LTRSKWISAILISAIWILLLVPAAQARPNSLGDGLEPARPEPAPKEKTQVYNPEQYLSTWGISPDVLINCDPQGSVLYSISPGSLQSYSKLQAGACRAQAAEEAAQLGANSSCGTCAGKASGYSGVSGESNMMKVYPVTTEVKYVYLQCGKKVASFGPPTCTCGGNWRYTYNCVKPKTVYITIPCH
jgi:hypothetical protein